MLSKHWIIELYEAKFQYFVGERNCDAPNETLQESSRKKFEGDEFGRSKNLSALRLKQSRIQLDQVSSRAFFLWDSNQEFVGMTKRLLTFIQFFGSNWLVADLVTRRLRSPLTPGIQWFYKDFKCCPKNILFISKFIRNTFECLNQKMYLKVWWRCKY